jgi:hypothetical protein
MSILRTPADHDVPVRRRQRTRRLALAGAVSGMIASVPALIPASPAHAITNPVLFVGGHTNQNEQLEGWADYIDGTLGLADDKVRAIELRTQPGWNYPFDSPDAGDWPGTASNEVSAGDIQAAIEDLYADYGNTPVEVIAISQGALATRWLLQSNPSNVRSKVASYISFGGANAGIPDNFFLSLCDVGDWAPACNEMVYESLPGDNNWIEYEVNMWHYTLGVPVQDGDPTPGTLPYYHVYTANDGPSGLPNDPGSGKEIEATTPYGWSVPLLGASNRSAQDDCGASYVAPHGGWNGSTPDPVMEHLLLDALNRNSLDAPATLC